MERCQCCDRPLAPEPDTLCPECEAYMDDRPFVEQSAVPLPPPPDEVPQAEQPTEETPDDSSGGCAGWVFGACAIMAMIGVCMSGSAERTGDESMANLSSALMLPYIVLSWGITLLTLVLGIAALFSRKKQR